MKQVSVRLSVRPSVRPSISVPSFGRRTAALRRVCCYGPDGKKISIGCCTADAQQQTRAVPRCQLTREAEV